MNGFAETMDMLARKKKANEIAILAMEKQIERPPIRKANERGSRIGCAVYVINL